MKHSGCHRLPSAFTTGFFSKKKKKTALSVKSITRRVPNRPKAGNNDVYKSALEPKLAAIGTINEYFILAAVGTFIACHGSLQRKPLLALGSAADPVDTQRARTAPPPI